MSKTGGQSPSARAAAAAAGTQRKSGRPRGYSGGGGSGASGKNNTSRPSADDAYDVYYGKGTYAERHQGGMPIEEEAVQLAYLAAADLCALKRIPMHSFNFGGGDDRMLYAKLQAMPHMAPPVIHTNADISVEGLNGCISRLQPPDAWDCLTGPPDDKEFPKTFFNKQTGAIVRLVIVDLMPTAEQTQEYCALAKQEIDAWASAELKRQQDLLALPQLRKEIQALERRGVKGAEASVADLKGEIDRREGEAQAACQTVFDILSENCHKMAGEKYRPDITLFETWYGSLQHAASVERQQKLLDNYAAAMAPDAALLTSYPTKRRKVVEQVQYCSLHGMDFLRKMEQLAKKKEQFDTMCVAEFVDFSEVENIFYGHEKGKGDDGEHRSSASGSSSEHGGEAKILGERRSEKSEFEVEFGEVYTFECVGSMVIISKKDGKKLTTQEQDDIQAFIHRFSATSARRPQDYMKEESERWYKEIDHIQRVFSDINARERAAAGHTVASPFVTLCPTAPQARGTLALKLTYDDTFFPPGYQKTFSSEEEAIAFLELMKINPHSHLRPVLDSKNPTVVKLITLTPSEGTRSALKQQVSTLHSHIKEMIETLNALEAQKKEVQDALAVLEAEGAEDDEQMKIYQDRITELNTQLAEARAFKSPSIILTKEALAATEKFWSYVGELTHARHSELNQELEELREQIAKCASAGEEVTLTKRYTEVQKEFAALDYVTPTQITYSLRAIRMGEGENVILGSEPEVTHTERVHGILNKLDASSLSPLDFLPSVICSTLLDTITTPTGEDIYRDTLERHLEEWMREVTALSTSDVVGAINAQEESLYEWVTLKTKYYDPHGKKTERAAISAEIDRIQPPIILLRRLCQNLKGDPDAVSNLNRILQVIDKEGDPTGEHAEEIKYLWPAVQEPLRSVNFLPLAGFSRLGTVAHNHGLFTSQDFLVLNFPESQEAPGKGATWPTAALAGRSLQAVCGPMLTVTHGESNILCMRTKQKEMDLFAMLNDLPRVARGPLRRECWVQSPHDMANHLGVVSRRNFVVTMAMFNTIVEHNRKDVSGRKETAAECFCRMMLEGPSFTLTPQHVVDLSLGKNIGYKGLPSFDSAVVCADLPFSITGGVAASPPDRTDIELCVQALVNTLDGIERCGGVRYYPPSTQEEKDQEKIQGALLPYRPLEEGEAQQVYNMFNMVEFRQGVAGPAERAAFEYTVALQMQQISHLRMLQKYMVAGRAREDDEKAAGMGGGGDSSDTFTRASALDLSLLDKKLYHLESSIDDIRGGGAAGHTASVRWEAVLRETSALRQLIKSPKCQGLEAYQLLSNWYKKNAKNTRIEHLVQIVEEELNAYEDLYSLYRKCQEEKVAAPHTVAVLESTREERRVGRESAARSTLGESPRAFSAAPSPSVELMAGEQEDFHLFLRDVYLPQQLEAAQNALDRTQLYFSLCYAPTEKKAEQRHALPTFVRGMDDLAEHALDLVPSATKQQQERWHAGASKRAQWWDAHQAASDFRATTRANTIRDYNVLVGTRGGGVEQNALTEALHARMQERLGCHLRPPLAEREVVRA